MLAKLRRVRTPTWLLLGVIVAVSAVLLALRFANVMSGSAYLYIAQPLGAVVVAGVAYWLGRGYDDRVRHKTDKALMVGSVLAIWFVAYFACGVISTYTHNPLVADWRSVLLNLYSYAVVACCLEYARHAVMMMAGRRNVVWFGVIVSLVCAVQLVNVVSLGTARGAEDIIKLLVADTVPMIALSFLLTYLSVTTGLGGMITLRLGLALAMILPPIVPKLDWYVLGVSLVVLVVAVYIALDRSQQPRRERTHRRKHRVSRAYDIMFGMAMIIVMLFMSGFFAYRPSVIMSNSMQPVFSRGSMVFIEKIANPMDIQVGDIIQYNSQGKAITHRVTAIDTESGGSTKRVFTAKGDNNPSKDPPVAEQQVVGIVRAQIPYVGYPSVWVKEVIR